MKIKAFFSDYLGIISAVLCLIHCLLAPTLMGAYAHSHEAIHSNESGEFFLHHNWDYVFLGLGLLAVWLSSRHTSQLALKVLLWLTYGFLAASVLLEGQGELFQNLVYISSIALIMVHVLNIRHWWKHVKTAS